VRKIKEKIAYSDASQTVRDASDAFFKALETGGIKVEAGMKDSKGEILTQERVDKIRKTINDATWAIIDDGYEVIEKPSS